MVFSPVLIEFQSTQRDKPNNVSPLQTGFQDKSLYHHKVPVVKSKRWETNGQQYILHPQFVFRLIVDIQDDPTCYEVGWDTGSCLSKWKYLMKSPEGYLRRLVLSRTFPISSGPRKGRPVKTVSDVGRWF